MPEKTSSNRLVYLDWLRFIVVLLLVPFHAAISYTGMGSVYVYDTSVRDILLAGGTPVGMGPQALSLFTVFLDNWFMNLLFLISGIGAAFSLRKRSSGQFMLERCNRLLLPLLVGVVCIVPIQSWLRALAFGKFSGSFFAFYPKFFNGIYTGPFSSGNYDNGQFWFLLYLFVFSAIALPLFISIRNRAESSRILAATRKFGRMPWLLLGALWLGLLEGLFRPGWPGNFTVINDWAVFTINFSFFVIGYLLAYTPELLQAIGKYRFVLLGFGLTAFLLRMGVYRFFAVHDGYNAANIAAQVFRGITAYGLVLGAIGCGQYYLKMEGKWLGIARDLSFPLYVLHYVPVTAMTYLLLNTGLSGWARWGITVTVSWSFVALFTYIARYIPLVRDFFNVRKPVPKPKEAHES